MAAKENSVYSVTQQFCRSFSEVTPESVLYGYAKLLLMDEAAIKNLLQDDEVTDLNNARKLIETNRLDLNLIKSGSLLLAQVMQLTKEEEEKYKAFEKFLEECSEDTTSVDILEKVFEYIAVPVHKIYAQGGSMDAVFDYQRELKKKIEGLNQETKKEEPKEEQPEEKPAESVSSEEETDRIKSIFASSEEAKKEEKPEQTEPKKSSEQKEAKNETLLELSERYRNLSTALHDVVKGQDQAVAKFVQGCFQGELLKAAGKTKQPRAYFFFFGPPGVGKTLLAETAAENLGRPHMLFNMSEYVSSQSIDELVGTPKVYKNYREGNLVKFVRENPKCILIFDEIEKAHISVLRLFLQVLGSGRLTNVALEEDTSFEDAIIIFTSNVGKELYADRSVNLTTLPERVIINAIQSEKNAFGEQVLPNEICSRIASGNTIMFNHLSVRHLAEMVNHNFEKISTAMSELYSCHVTYSNSLPLLFLYNRGGEIDARVASNQSGNFLKSEIYELARQIENRRTANKEITSIHFDIDWTGLEPELKKLFVNDTQTEVLILAEESVQQKFKADSNKYKVYYANSIEEAREYLKQDIVAVFVDPFFGKQEENADILSITDYNTEGIRFFYELAEAQTGLPVYLLEVDKVFSEIDRRTFLQIGAANTIAFDSKQIESFTRHFEQILDEVYMEKESCTFSQQGWVIDFKSKQGVTEDGKINVLFYDLKKRQAVDVESRGTLLSEAERPTVSFADVVGAEKAKEELKYFIEYLKNPKRFLIMGGKPPKGILLYGPPGTGKTMLAKAMAGESDVTFIQTSASEFKNKYVGESEANIRRIFQKAKRYAPAIIFIDEIDAIGKQRSGTEFTAVTDSMLNALLTEMDGFASDNKKPVFVLAATNFGVRAGDNGISSLDSALLRRFDNKIYVDLPNEKERKQYLEVILSKRGDNKVSEQVIKNIAERTTGQSLAILQNVIELAYRNATKENRSVEDNDLLNALEEYLYGEKRERTPEYYRSVAIHEIGHAYVSYISGDEPSYITIESRGDFGGYMQHANSEDVPSYTREELLARIRTSLAGRAAEQVFLGKEKALNTGASSDLRSATHYAFQIICTYGMEAGQLITLSKDEILKSAIAGEYVNQINEILNREMTKTISLIEEGRDKIQTIVNELVSRNHLTGAEFKELMK